MNEPRTHAGRRTGMAALSAKRHAARVCGLHKNMSAETHAMYRKAACSSGGSAIKGSVEAWWRLLARV